MGWRWMTNDDGAEGNYEPFARYVGTVSNDKRYFYNKIPKTCAARERHLRSFPSVVQVQATQDQETRDVFGPVKGTYMGLDID